MRRRGLFEGSILDPALDDAPAPCPPVEQLRHPTHWATYRSASLSRSATQNAVLPAVAAVEPRSPQGATAGFLARRQATQLFQAATGTLMAGLAVSTLLCWQRSHTATMPRVTVPSVAASPVSAERAAPSRVAELPDFRASAASPASGAAQDDEVAPPPLSDTTPAPAAATAPAPPSSAPPAPAPPAEAAALSAPRALAPMAAVADAPARVSPTPAPVAKARMMRASFAPPVLVPAEPEAVRGAARAPRPAPAPVARRAAPRAEAHLAAARPSLPRWLTETRRTPLVMSEPPHDLVAPAGAVSTPAPPPLPPLREVTRPAARAVAPRWYGGPVYQPYGRYIYGGPYGPASGPYGSPYGPPPGYEGARTAQPEDVTID